MSRSKRNRPPLEEVYRLLFNQWGPQFWWPGRTRLEIIVGAILTQNTAWTNVEKAICRLRKARALNLRRLHSVDLKTLAEWIRPAGYFNVKARRLRSFTQLMFGRFGGDLRRLFALETPALREVLLSVNGIGPETADAIVLYAFSRPSCVADAYTRRIFSRHGHVPEQISYEALRAYFMEALPVDVPLYNEYHALIVRVGNVYCKKRKPLCAQCPLGGFLKRGAAGNPA